MPPLRDANTIERIREALMYWHNDGVFCLRRPTEDIDRYLDGYELGGVVEEMLKFIDGGGEINVAEDRTEFRSASSPYHYEFRMPIAGKNIYIETILSEAKRGPVLTIVSLHP